MDKLLEQVKGFLTITIDDPEFDTSLKLKIMATKQYLKNGGASEESLSTEIGISCIAIGSNDLLNEDAGETKFSPAFQLLANQVCRM